MIDTTKKINLLEACNRVVKDEANKVWISPEEFATGLGFEGYYYGQEPGDFHDVVKGYHLLTWNCTDTWVGIVAYFWNDQFVGYSAQEARKSRADYVWLRPQTVLILREYMQPAYDINQLSFIGAHDELEEYRTFNYRDAVIDDHGVVNGKPVAVDRAATHELYKATSPNSFERALFDKLVVRGADDEARTIPVQDFHVRLRITDPEVPNSNTIECNGGG